MGLQKQNIPISLAQGIDTKTDPKQVVIGKLTNLQNGIFQTTKEISKRNGFNSLTQNIQGGGSISNGVSIGTYNSELVELDGSNLYSYNASAPNFVNKGELKNVSAFANPVVSTTNTQEFGDSAINGSLQAFAWLDTGGITYSIFDTATNQSIVSNQLLSATGETVKVLSIGSYFVFIYYDTTTFSSIYYRAISTATPTVLGGQTTIASDLNTSWFIFDAEVIGSNIIIAYGTQSPSVALYSLSSTLVLSSQYVAAASTTPEQAITVFGDASNNSWVAWGNGSNLQALIVNSTLNANIQNKTNIDSVANLVNVTGAVTGTTGTIYYETGIAVASTLSPSLYNSVINQNTFTTGGAVGSPSVLNRGLGLASKAFIYNSTYYIFTMFPTFLQSLYFLIDQSANVIAKFTQGLGGQITNAKILPEVNLLSSGVYQTAVEMREQLFSPPATISGRQPGAYSKTGIQSLKINFNGNWPSKINLGDNLHYSGGYIHMYDGANVVEHSFHIYPEGISASSVATSGGGIGIGASSASINQVQYIALFRYTDNQGQTHRSCPSIALTVQLPKINAHTWTGNCTLNSNSVTSLSSTTSLVVGQVVSNTNFPAGTYITGISALSSAMTLSQNATATATGTTFSTSDLGANTISCPTLRTTAKQNVQVDFYRTENNQTIFYLLGSTANNKAADSISFVDTTPDQEIIGNEQLYTTGGTVENIAAPAAICMTEFKNRAIVVPYNSTAWWYSQQVIPGSPVEFSDLFTENVDSRISKITAAKSLDEKLILFGPDSKYFVVGDGPAPSGVNNDFTEAQRLAGVTGCANQASILEIPIGLVYQDPTKGIYLLDRSLQEQYIGADVEAYNSFQVTSAHIIPGQTIIRFTLSNGLSLTYDYIAGQWGTDQYAAAAIDSTVYNSTFYYVTAAGLVEQETPGSYTDNSLVVPLGLETGWMSFAQIEGYQRVYEFQLFGQYFSPHTLTVNFYINYSSTPAQTATINVPSAVSPYQFRVRLNDQVQRCEAVRVQITESQTGTLGQGLSLSGLAFRVGIKQGLFKLPATQSY